MSRSALCADERMHRAVHVTVAVPSCDGNRMAHSELLIRTDSPTDSALVLPSYSLCLSWMGSRWQQPVPDCPVSSHVFSSSSTSRPQGRFRVIHARRKKACWRRQTGGILIRFLNLLAVGSLGHEGAAKNSHRSVLKRSHLDRLEQL